MNSATYVNTYLLAPTSIRVEFPQKLLETDEFE